MHSPDLRPLAAELLSSHGYTVHRDETLEGRSGAVYEVPVLAEGPRVLLVEFKDSPDPVEAADVDYLHRLVDDAGADHAVLIHQGPAGNNVQRRADVSLWGPQAFRQAMGDVLVHEQTGAPLTALPLGVAAPSPAPTVVPEIPVEPATAELPSIDFDAFAEAPPAPPATTTVPEEPSTLPDLSDMLPSAFQEEPAFDGLDFDSLESLEAPVPAAPEPVPTKGFGPSALRPRIPVHEARAMVKDRISSIDEECLQLWPVHILDYECDLMVDGTLKQDTVSGRIEVRGDKKGTAAVDRETIDVATIGTIDWTGPVTDHAFRRDADVAKTDAKRLIMEMHTKMVDMEVDDEASDFSMTERKKVAPDGDQIRLEHRAATYRPAWRFESANGHVVIDALSGETLEEQLRTRAGETIIVD